jgi:hypothetical protein
MAGGLYKLFEFGLPNVTRLASENILGAGFQIPLTWRNWWRAVARAIVSELQFRVTEP